MLLEAYVDRTVLSGGPDGAGKPKGTVMAKVRLEANTQAWCVVEQSSWAGDGGWRSDRDEVECVGRWARG